MLYMYNVTIVMIANATLYTVFVGAFNFKVFH